MTVNAVRRARRRPVPPLSEQNGPSSESLAIGEIDQTVFDCPRCSRPLAVGTRRCPGCRTRLMAGVPLSRASGFVAVGLAVGLAVGGAGGAAFGLTQVLAAAPPTPIVAASAAPITGGQPGSTAPPLPSALPGSGGSTSGMPSISSSALVQAASVNDRLRAAEASLRSALAASRFDASLVAQTLRTISADTVYGQQLAGKIAAWPGSASVGNNIGLAYNGIHDTAVEALVQSVTNTTAYKQSASAMIRLLAGLSAVDAQIVAVATTNGVTLPEASPQP
jgi:hypothetical protein